MPRFLYKRVANEIREFGVSRSVAEKRTIVPEEGDETRLMRITCTVRVRFIGNYRFCTWYDFGENIDNFGWLSDLYFFRSWTRGIRMIRMIRLSIVFLRVDRFHCR